MKIRNILLLLVIAALASCVYDDDGEFPSGGNPDGEYSYNSFSKYYDRNERLEYESPSKGYLEYLTDWGGAHLYISPNYGWSYQIYISNLVDRNGITTFSIHSQDFYLNNKNFRIRGTNEIPVYDTAGSIIGFYDGYMTGDSIILEYDSRDNDEQENVITKMNCKKIN